MAESLRNETDPVDIAQFEALFAAWAEARTDADRLILTDCCGKRVPLEVSDLSQKSFMTSCRQLEDGRLIVGHVTIYSALCPGCAAKIPQTVILPVDEVRELAAALRETAPEPA